MEADTEILAVAVQSLKALGFKKFCVKLNNRKILSGLMDLVNIPEKKKFEVFRAIDKLDKFGEDTVKNELKAAELKPNQIKELFKLIMIEGLPEEVIKKGERILQNAVGSQGLNELKEMIEFSKSYGFTDKIVIDFSLARGLDYYTGPIFEIVDTSGKNIGSLAGGGRYDDLIELFGGKPTPATGISLGIERIIEVMKQGKMFNVPRTNIKVFVANVNEEVKNDTIKIAQELRNNGISCQVDLMDRSLSRQFEFADSLGVPYTLVVGPKEMKKSKFVFKDMETGKELELSIEKIIKKIISES
jgi:histidyl-tRNA synthetase